MLMESLSGSPIPLQTEQPALVTLRFKSGGAGAAGTISAVQSSRPDGFRTNSFGK